MNNSISRDPLIFPRTIESPLLDIVNNPRTQTIVTLASLALSGVLLSKKLSQTPSLSEWEFSGLDLACIFGSALLLNGAQTLKTMRDSLASVPPAERLPLHLYKTLAQANLSKTEKDPLAVWIFPKSDWNGAFSQTMNKPLLTSSETHRVALRTVGNATELQTALTLIKKEHGPIDVLFLCGHGNQEQLQLDSSSFLSTCTDYASILKAVSGGETRSIHLISCSTGSLTHYPNLAESIARRTHTTVFAPSKASRMESLRPCLHHGFDSSYKSRENNRELGRTFFPNERSESCAFADCSAL